MKILPAVLLCVLAVLPWQMVSAGELGSAISQVMAKKQVDLQMAKDMVWFLYAAVLLSGLVAYGCCFVSKKMAERRVRQAEKSRS